MKKGPRLLLFVMISIGAHFACFIVALMYLDVVAEGGTWTQESTPGHVEAPDASGAPVERDAVESPADPEWSVFEYAYTIDSRPLAITVFISLIIHALAFAFLSPGKAVQSSRRGTT